jgi:hypothetical protein
MTATQISPIDRLAVLSTQRTARTDRLHEAACALLSQLEDHAEVGTEVTVDSCTLSLVRVRSNVGYTDFWLFSDDGDESAHIEQPVGYEGYLHGDFHAATRGPSRANLIAFAVRADRFVAALIAREEATLAALAAAQTTTDSAAASL